MHESILCVCTWWWWCVVEEYQQSGQAIDFSRFNIWVVNCGPSNPDADRYGAKPTINMEIPTAKYGKTTKNMEKYGKNTCYNEG